MVLQWLLVSERTWKFPFQMEDTSSELKHADVNQNIIVPRTWATIFNLFLVGEFKVKMNIYEIL